MKKTGSNIDKFGISKQSSLLLFHEIYAMIVDILKEAFFMKKQGIYG